VPGDVAVFFLFSTVNKLAVYIESYRFTVALFYRIINVSKTLLVLIA